MSEKIFEKDSDSREIFSDKSLQYHEVSPKSFDAFETSVTLYIETAYEIRENAK
jgi:hypothetical protein